MQQQVVEVEHRDLTAGLERLIAGVDVGQFGRVQRDVPAGFGHRRRVLLRSDQGCLGPFDLAGHVADVVVAQAQAGVPGRACDHPEFAVQQFPGGVADHPRPEVAQLAAGGGVEGQRLYPADPGGRTRSGRRTQRPQPRPHLPGGALGERHRQHLSGCHMAAGHQLGDPVGDGAGLAGTGAGQHAHRPARCQHGGTLLLVESGDERIHGVHLGRRPRRPRTPIRESSRHRLGLGSYGPARHVHDPMVWLLPAAQGGVEESRDRLHGDRYRAGPHGGGVRQLGQRR